MSGAIEIAACSAEEILAHPLFPSLRDEAAAECANPDLSPVLPDAELYRTLEQSGFAHAFRCGCGEELNGFAVVLFAPSGHNGRRYATVESLFVANAARNGGAGYRLMDVLESAARNAGCEAITYSAHVGSRLARLLFLRSDQYVNTNHIFCKRLR
ncbi:MAG TPA: GNAT family N-acetyltransferase [Terracidiphilus sp.]|nr:GNAT family N-acetyltransferase [Terracidiphilus sp.]